MQKKIIIFEGFGSAGKTTLIEKLRCDLINEFKIEILDIKHPKYASILFNDNEEISLNKNKYVYFCFRWTRLFLFFNSIVNSDSDLFFFDRGILTNYIYGKEDNIPDHIINELVNCFLDIMKKHNIIYKTVFVDCDLEIANTRCKSRKDTDVGKKINRNDIFAPYFKDLSTYYFINSLSVINSSNSILENYNELLQFIKN